MDVYIFAMLLVSDRGCEQSTNAQRESLKPNMPTEMVELRIIAVVVDVMLMLMLMMTLTMTCRRRYNRQYLEPNMVETRSVPSSSQWVTVNAKKIVAHSSFTTPDTIQNI